MTAARSIVPIAIAAMLAAPLSARDKAPAKPNTPPALGKVLDCRTVAESAARLACYDAAVASLDQAVAGGDVAVVDREAVRKTKRGLFGFSFSDLPLFGRGDDDKAEQDEVKEITATLRDVGSGRDGLVFTLEDGARWEQTDSVSLGRRPRAGDQVTIKRMALGSYKMSFKIGPSMKVRRIG